ncbi:MAG: dipeptide/oligopeptide/nickel ABC transporter ATP-binding protein [Anaerolineaceae bacterium]|nr:dipeptide/oligopeptide/nickel ABC transporter ATP-binding protein [Anaerolineaceae bacterium]
MNSNDVLLEVNNLKTHFHLDEGVVRAVDGVDFTVRRGTTLGIVGESGCGKSITALSILRLITKPGEIVDGQIRFNRSENGTPDFVDLATMGDFSREIRDIRGNRIAMIFQEPMNSLSPVHTIGFQIIEVLRLHLHMSKREARLRAIELLRLVGIPRPEMRIDSYTFQLSGGMRQRAMIAMALACTPALLIADEPTTALDVTTQAQILELVKDLQQQFGMTVMLITHDLGVVAETCNEVVVMYLGEVVEQADVDSLFFEPLHPYTQALLRSIPMLGEGREQELATIEGSIPDPFDRPTGCPFHPRCDQMIPGRCDRVHPKLTRMPDGRMVRCLLYEEETPA